MESGQAAAAPAAHDVELRIHGVSGTPPAALLGAEHVRQVAGDERSRFFRPCDVHGVEARTDPDHLLEGYHWGQFTAGTWRQGLWLVLIPFGIVNAAAFMLPDPRRLRAPGRRVHAAVAALIRLIGVGQTCTIALATSLVLVDLLVAPAQRVSWLRSVPDRWLPWVTAAAAAAVVVALYLLGRQPRFQPSSPPPATSLAADLVSGAAPGAPGLARHRFYGGRLHAPTLSRLHLAAGLGVVGQVVGLERGLDATAPDPPLLAVALAVLVVGVAVVTTLLGDPERSTLESAGHHTWHRVADALSWLAVVAAPSLLVAALLSGPAGAPHQPVDLDRAARVLVDVMTVVMVVLLLANLALVALRAPDAPRPPRDFRPYAAGLAPWAATSVGVFLGIGYSAAAVLAPANAVGGAPPSPLVVRIAHAWGVTVVVAAVAVVGALAWVTWSARRGVAEVRASFEPLWHPDDPQHSRTLPRRHRTAEGWEVVPESRRACAEVARAVQLARLKYAVPAVFLGSASLGLLLTVAVDVETRWGDLPWLLGEVSETTEAGSSTLLADLGTYALVALAGALLLLGRRAVRVRDTRRGVNILWDVVSFWPHSAHPFVPPPYSQTAVPAVAERVRFHLGGLGVQPPEGRPADHVVVAPHSQGSLIAVASLLWLTADELSRVGLLTHGSQLQAAFPRAFPAYVDHDLLAGLQARLAGRWVNLFRDTDPIAGPVLSWDRTPMTAGPPRSRRLGQPPGAGAAPDRVDAVTGRRECGPDWRLLDPTPADNDRMLSPRLAMQRHSDYHLGPDWASAVDAVRPRPTTAEQSDGRAAVPAPT